MTSPMKATKRSGITRSQCLRVMGSVIVVFFLLQLKEIISVKKTSTTFPSSKQTQSILSLSERQARWDYYPSPASFSSSQKRSYGQKHDRPRYGILMGGTSDYFRQQTALQSAGDSFRDGRSHDVSSVTVTTCIAKLYAMNMGYAFKLVTNLENVSSRIYGPCPAEKMSAWHKIQLVRTYLPDVDYILWLDLDALIVRPTITLDNILNPLYKETTDLGAWMCASKGQDAYHRSITGSDVDPFFFASKDINPRYNINLNTGVFAVKNSPLAFDFLKRVWEVGDDVNAFKKHDPWWRHKTPCTDYWGWPWEQGGIWDVLADSTHLEFLRGTIFLPSEGEHGLNSVTDSDLVPGDDFTFILHGKGRNEMLGFRYITRTLLDVLQIRPEILNKECPVVAQQQYMFVNVSTHYATLLRKMMMS